MKILLHGRKKEREEVSEKRGKRRGKNISMKSGENNIKKIKANR